ALCGLVAGLAASPSTAYALLTPLLRAVTGGAEPKKRGAAPAALALAISASHGLALISPVPIAAASILDAPWSRVALFGVPLAVLVAGLGAAWSRWLTVADEAPQAPAQDAPTKPTASGWSAAVLVVATAVPLALLIFQSLGDIPSEPLGGGTAREMGIGLGRPLVLLVVGIGIMVIGNARLAGKRLADDAWNLRVFSNVAGAPLAVGAGGGRAAPSRGGRPAAALPGDRHGRIARRACFNLASFRRRRPADRFSGRCDHQDLAGLLARRRHHRRRHRAPAIDPAGTRRC